MGSAARLKKKDELQYRKGSTNASAIAFVPIIPAMRRLTTANRGGMIMLKKLVTYIEQEPWDEAIERQDKYLRRFIVCVLILAAIYFSPFILYIFTR